MTVTGSSERRQPGSPSGVANVAVQIEISPLSSMSFVNAGLHKTGSTQGGLHNPGNTGYLCSAYPGTAGYTSSSGSKQSRSGETPGKAGVESACDIYYVGPHL